MKLVTYVVKDDQLNIQSTHLAGARLGWVLDDYVIDVGFAQQWLIYFRCAPFSWLLPRQLSEWFEQEQDFSKLLQIYEAIIKENPVELQIEGEPVTLPIDEVHLLSPLLSAEKIFYPPANGAKSVIGTNDVIKNPQRFNPGIGFILSTSEGKPVPIGCCLINGWYHTEQTIFALGPYLVTFDELKKTKKHCLKVFRNGELIDQRLVDVWTLFTQNMAQHLESSVLVPGLLMSFPVRERPFSVQLGDLVEIEMESFGRLQNRVDKE